MTNKNKKKRKIKKPIVIDSNAIKSLRVAKRITADFHENQNKEGLTTRDKYQKASIAALKRTSHVKNFVYSTLTSLGKIPKKGERTILLGLEIGAVNLQFISSPNWIKFRSIDLLAQHPKIEKRDFFTLEVVENTYDVILNSMVLNCVPESEMRGSMIERMAKMIKANVGLLFITIPRRCVESNPHCSVDIFNACLNACGLVVKLQKMSPKIAFWVCAKEEENNLDLLKEKEVILERSKAAYVRNGACESRYFSISFFKQNTIPHLRER